MTESAAMEIRHHTVSAGGLRIHVAEAGPVDGPPVLLLHGFPECWYSWRRQLPALAQAGFRAIAPDLRGYNLSDKPGRIDDYAPDKLAGDVVSLANALGYKRLDVVGHDWGGAVAWLTAAFPATRHVVRRLIVLNAPHPALFVSQLDWAQVRRSWYMLFFQLPHLPEWLLSRNDWAFLRKIFAHTRALRQNVTDADFAIYRQSLSQPGALTATINYYRAALRQNPLTLPKRIEPVEAETLLIWGERDAALGRQLTEGLSQAVPRLRIEYLPAGHFVHLEQPDEVNRLLIDTLSQPLRIPTVN